MKTISMAAKQGIEAAAKVKELETDNKKLSEENVVLTKNFESERVGVMSCSKELLQFSSPALLVFSVRYGQVNCKTHAN